MGGYCSKDEIPHLNAKVQGQLGQDAMPIVVNTLATLSPDRNVQNLQFLVWIRVSRL